MISNTIPVGGLFFAWCTLMAVAPIRRPRRLAVASWIASSAPNELPFVFLVIVVASSAPTVMDGDLTTGDWISIALALLTAAGLVVVARRAGSARPAVEKALAESLGTQWPTVSDPALASRLSRRLPWARILFFPWPLRPRDVERMSDIRYGDNGDDNLLDVHRHRSHPTGSPTLIYLHGGRFRWGRKGREARPLIHRLASHGWTCISANYHLSPTPAAGFPQHLIDVKKVIAWARTDGRDHGVDPNTIFVAGSSAGAHLTAMTALTANDPRFQPGFEEIDTSITAGIGLYGYYGELGATDDVPTTPLAYTRADAPPLFIVHGDNDTYASVEGARALVDGVRAESANPVVYAELPCAQHSFDVFHSIRFEAVVDAIEAFAAWRFGTDASSVRPVRAVGRAGRGTG